MVPRIGLVTQEKSGELIPLPLRNAQLPLSFETKMSYKPKEVRLNTLAVCAETYHRDPAGTQSRPRKSGQHSEASLAPSGGEAQTASVCYLATGDRPHQIR